MIHSPWLPAIPGLHRRDPEHRYWLGDLEFPVSVTGVLSVLKSDFAMQRIKTTRATWEPRGNSCHRALELLMLTVSGAPLLASEVKGRNMAELFGLLNGPHADWIQPLTAHERWAQVEVVASERPTCCTRRQVAGTFDLAYIDPSLPPSPDRPAWATGPARVLADLKSLGENGATYSTAAQLGGYQALESTHGHFYDYGQTIWARPGQTTFSRLYPVAECRLAWAGAWATWRALHPRHPRPEPGIALA
jgi:hypothetical protein